MGFNEWGIDVNATTWFSALRGIIGGKASGGMIACNPIHEIFNIPTNRI